MLRAATVISTREFESKIGQFLTDEEVAELEYSLATSPLAHPVVPGTEGVRKARWHRLRTGKRGGLRIIYFFAVSAEVILLITAYAKNEKEDLSSEDKRNIKRFVQVFKETLHS